MLIFCPECGKELSVSDSSRPKVFCRYCGAEVDLAEILSYPERADVSSKESDIPQPPKDATPEELRAWYDLRAEQLRHEHELELERLRHHNEMELERERAKNSASSTPKKTSVPEEDEIPYTPPPTAQKLSERTTWDDFCDIFRYMGEFLVKSILVIALLFALFRAVNFFTVKKDQSKAEYNYTAAYADHVDGGYYYLFDPSAQKVCMIACKAGYAYLADCSEVDFDKGCTSTFYFSEKNYTRRFQYSKSGSDNFLTVTIIPSDGGDITIRKYTKTTVTLAKDALSKASQVVDVTSPK